MVICKIGWSIRSWLSDYISFSFYKSYCRHDIYWILVAFMIAASALIKVSRLYGLYRQLYTQLIYWHCADILYTYVNLLNKRFWILNVQWMGRVCEYILRRIDFESGMSFERKLMTPYINEIGSPWNSISVIEHLILVPSSLPNNYLQIITSNLLPSFDIFRTAI